MAGVDGAVHAVFPRQLLQVPYSPVDLPVQWNRDRPAGHVHKGILGINGIPGDVVEFIADDDGPVFLFQKLHQRVLELNAVLNPDQTKPFTFHPADTPLDPRFELVPVRPAHLDRPGRSEDQRDHNSEVV